MRVRLPRALPTAKVRKSPAYKAGLATCRTLQRAGFEAFFVGGAVRDFLMQPHHCPQDIDLATDAPPETVMRLFPGSNYVGKEFGVVLVRHRYVVPKVARRPGGKRRRWLVFEVTTFRKEGPYSNRRHPDSVTPGTHFEDSCRRDFTWNAFYFDPVRRRLLDLHGGMADLAAHRIRAVGRAYDRFFEDSLRILRMCRFAANFHMTIEPQTEDAARRASDGLAALSRERVASEIRKVRVGKFVDFSAKLLKIISMERLDPNFGSLSLRPSWHREFPVVSRRVLDGGFYRDLPLVSLVFVAALGSDAPHLAYDRMSGALAGWPLTRQESRVLRAMHELRKEACVPGRTDEALHLFFEKMAEFSMRDVAMLVEFAASTLSCPVSSEVKEYLKRLVSPLAALGTLGFREWWSQSVGRCLPENYRSEFARAVESRGLPPNTIRMACILSEIPVWKEGLGLEGFRTWNQDELLEAARGRLAEV